MSPGPGNGGSYLWKWVNDPSTHPGVDVYDTPQGQRWYEIERLLLVTPTTTVEGMVAQAGVLVTYFEPEPDGDPDGPELTGVGVRDVVEAVRRFGGTA